MQKNIKKSGFTIDTLRNDGLYYGSSIKDFEDDRDCGFSVKLRMTKKDKKKKNGFPLSRE